MTDSKTLPAMNGPSDETKPDQAKSDEVDKPTPQSRSTAPTEPSQGISPGRRPLFRR
jgi:hypothetical protein